MSSSSEQRKHFSMEIRQPKMLKDFLLDYSNSCSSSGFKSFPRRPHKEIDHHYASSRSLIKSPFQAIINIIKKNIPFTAVMSPSILLPTSLSRKLSKRKSSDDEEDIKKVTVTVKDIMRWRSFRDLLGEEEAAKSQPLDCTITTTGSANSRCSSWCESDFTAEDLSPPWSSNSNSHSDEEAAYGKKMNLPCVGADSLEVTTEETTTDNPVGPKEQDELEHEDKEQHSPVSVLHFQLEEDHEELFSSFNQSLANMERSKQKLMQQIQRFETMAKLDPIDLEKWTSTKENMDREDDHEQEEEEEEPNEIEHKARWLMDHHVKDANRISEPDKMLLSDFFRDELGLKRDEECDCDCDSDSEIVKIAKAWLNGEHRMSVNWGLMEQERVGYVKEIDREWRGWGKFEELALEIEHGVLDFVVDELLNESLVLP